MSSKDNAEPRRGPPLPRAVKAAARRFFETPILGLGALLAGLAAVTAATVAAAPSRPPDADPLAAAKESYAHSCSVCHGTQMQGGGAPALKGAAFRAKWVGRPSKDLRDAIAMMPPGSPGAVTPRQRDGLYALILAANGMGGGDKLAIADASIGEAEAAAAASPVTLPEPPVLHGSAKSSAPGDADLVAAAAGDWLMYNRDYRGQRFSPLAQITPANAGRLTPRCMFQLGELGSFQASPVIHAGRMYLSTAHATYAIDAATCHRIWETRHEPRGGEGLANSRGVALYHGKIFRGTPDGWFYALDADTGAVLWEIHAADGNTNHALSAAVVAWDGKVFIGNAGGDRGATGRVYAFDADTGKHLWTFNTVPTGDEYGADTWGPDGQKLGGGGMWSTISVDPATGQLFVPVGNPGSDLDGSERPGANLFTNSVVVLNAATGKRDWHIQQIPHDLHDWNTAAAPVLYDRNGRTYMAVATKAGWLYLYDRATKAELAKSETSSHLNIDVAPGPDPVRICPGTLGGTEWNGPGYDPKLGALFVNSVERCAIFQSLPPGVKHSFGGMVKFDSPEQSYGWLRAFDAETGAQRWAWRADAPMVAGVTPTAGGVVMTGSLNGDFLVFDSAKGTLLYRFYTGGAVGGGVSTYSVGGRQLVAVTSGNASKTIWGATGAPTVVVFGLAD